jgi:hypothetical protein
MEKMGYFNKYWSSELQGDVVECVEKVVSRAIGLLDYLSFEYSKFQFKERYFLCSQSSVKLSGRPGKSKISVLLRELSEDEDTDDAGAGPMTPEDLAKPWLRDFRAYLDVVEHIPDGWTAIKWWGVSDSRCNTPVYKLIIISIMPIAIQCGHH